MNTEQQTVIDGSIKKLQDVKTCAIENYDIHDHYDCRESLKTVILDLQLLLEKTEA